MAKDLDIPIIALSQLNRSVESRSVTSKRPQLSDLRESGAIEQDADLVMFIYRPEYYKLETFDDQDHTPSEGLAEVIIAKHRNGSLDDIRLRFIKEQAKFCDIGGSFEQIQEPQQYITKLARGFEDSPASLPPITNFGNTPFDDVPY